MNSVEYDKRISSFFQVAREILTNESSEIEFDESDRVIYRTFADRLSKVFHSIHNGSEYISNIEDIIQRLENSYRVCMLEQTIQNNSLIASCFLKGGYKYHKENGFEVWKLRDFIKFFKSIPIEKQKIVLNNIWQRLDRIERINNYVDDLPF